MIHRRFANTRVLVALGAVVLLLGVAWSVAPRDDYANGSVGFTMSPPKFGFGTEASGATIARFYAAPSNGFAANLGLQLHRAKFLDFCTASEVSFKDSGLTLVTQKDVTIGKATAREYRCRGRVNNFDLEFLFLIIARGDDTWQLTATALASEFTKVEPTFRAAMESFRSDKP